jgi:hypothetical protein
VIEPVEQLLVLALPLLDLLAQLFLWILLLGRDEYAATGASLPAQSWLLK